MKKKKKHYYNHIKNSLIGQKIKQVFYEELDYDDNAEYWDLKPTIHSIDMNVIFRLENDLTIQIKWDNEFYCYGIGIEELKSINQREGIKTIEVSENSNWSDLLNKEITEINVFWDIDENAIETKYDNNNAVSQQKFTINLPQTWGMKFENEKQIWISALEIMEDGKVQYWHDHLTVFFEENGLKEYKLATKFYTNHLIN